MDKNSKISEVVLTTLAKSAREAAKLSYSPYSGCCVGAALLAADGEIFKGANIENAAYSPTICAERVAFSNAIIGGKKSFLAIAVYGEIKGKRNEKTLPSDKIKPVLFPPCGVCRQFMSEFCDDDFIVLFVSCDGYETYKFSELFPHRFSL